MTSLTARTVQALIKAREPGKFGDGRGLYLKVPQKVRRIGCFDTQSALRDEKSP